MRARLPLRLLRAAVFAVVCVLLAVAGHRAAGGAGPAGWAVAAATAAVTAVTALLTGRERSAQTINGFLVATQFVLHELFGASESGISAAFHLRHGDGLGTDIGMLTAHLTVTLITGWWLARGEYALWSVLRRLGTLVVRPLLALLALLARGPAGPVRPAAPAPRHLLPVMAPRLRHAVSRRGPPLPALR
ncbi:MFS transporter [Sphaerisporangium rufum]|nr:MFS transporter [Sphaerisporangium rufum]